MNFEDTMLKTGNPILYTEGFQLYVEAHLTYLRANPSTAKVPPPPELVHKNSGDLTSLLLDMGIATEHHYLIMRMSGLTSPDELDENLKVLLVPDVNLVARLIQIYQSSEGKV